MMRAITKMTIAIISSTKIIIPVVVGVESVTFLLNITPHALLKSTN